MLRADAALAKCAVRSVDVRKVLAILRKFKVSQNSAEGGGHSREERHCGRIGSLFCIRLKLL
jgi:hypothetical protein